MNIFILPCKNEKEFELLAKSLVVTGNEKEFRDYGFTNAYKPRLYWCKQLKERDNYDVSFGISINKKRMKISDFEILDENFCQPIFCSDDELLQIKDIIHDMVSHGLFTIIN